MNRISPSLRQSLFWCALLVIELLSLITPAVILTFCFIMVPALILYLRLDLKQFGLAYISSLFVLFAVLGGGDYAFVMILASLIFIPPTVAMGQLYKRKAAAKSVLLVGVLVLVGELLLLLFMGYASGMDPVGNIQAALADNVAQLPKEYSKYIDTSAIEKFSWTLPLLLVTFAAFYVFITHAITRKLLKKSAAPLPGLPPIREWRLPKSMVGYFLIVMVIGLFLTDQSDLYFQMIVYNLLPLFIMLFVIQAASLIFAFVYYKRWSRLIPVVMILSCLFQPILFLVCIIGIMDILMPLRERFFKL